MATKSNKSALKFTTSQKALIATALDVGSNVADGFNAAINLFKSIGQKNAKAVDEAARLYRIGYVSRYLQPHYSKRWGNLDLAGVNAAAEAIIAKAGPDSSKADRRTDLEHKAVRAADVSISTAKKRAGFVATKKGNRTARPGSTATKGKAAPTTLIKTDLVKASPTFKEPANANGYFGTAAAALLATVNKNSKHIDPRVSSAVSDFHAALKAAGFIG